MSLLPDLQQAGCRIPVVAPRGKHSTFTCAHALDLGSPGRAPLPARNPLRRAAASQKPPNAPLAVSKCFLQMPAGCLYDASRCLRNASEATNFIKLLRVSSNSCLANTWCASTTYDDASRATGEASTSMDETRTAIGDVSPAIADA